MLNLSRLTAAATLSCATAAVAHAAPQVTIIHSFTGALGDTSPTRGVAIGAHGELYGTTYAGGWHNNGTVFELRRLAGGEWATHVIYFFRGEADGANPYASVVVAPNGTLYGTAYGGGGAQAGTVYTLTPPADGQHKWTFTLLRAFAGNYNLPSGQLIADGANPEGKLLLDGSGRLFGNTVSGGNEVTGAGLVPYFGTWFSLTRRTNGHGWQEQQMYLPGTDPSTTLVFDGAGDICGASAAGTFLSETVYFCIGPAANWSLFDYPGNHGSDPNDAIVGNDGALYVTDKDGLYYHQGSVNRIAPSPDGKTPGKLTQLHNFADDGVDGTYPLGPLTQAPDGTFYGTTSAGGAYGLGTIYQMTPPHPGYERWSEAVVYSFNVAGQYPAGKLTLSPTGVYYGTLSPKSGMGGSVFAFTP